MSILLADSSIDIYWQYLQHNCRSLHPNTLPDLVRDLEPIVWHDPESALDFNNFAVMLLVEAGQTEDLTIRAMNLDMALEALNAGIEQDPSHPLCFAHLALIYCMIGEVDRGMSPAFSVFLETLHSAHTAASLPLGLVYLPSEGVRGKISHTQTFQSILQAKDGYTQTLLLAAWILSRYHLVFYSSTGIRFMRSALQLMPNSAEMNLKLGLANVMNQEWEGLLQLHQAQKIAPDHAPITQALYLSYQKLQWLNIAEFWLQTGRKHLQQQPQSLDWQWASLEPSSALTYVPFSNSLLIAVEANLSSIVTIVLLGEGDWFEAEMEFWRTQLQPGMTVIDVGANVGVYAFSAAQQVGAKGKVFAVEPFSSCVKCLQETRRINQLDWVTVCAGAASDRPGTAKLALHSASELNEIIQDDSLLQTKAFEEITCFMLDDLIKQETVERVDWLKIDAEGHEMHVLRGSRRLLAEFKPRILYENIAGAKGSNVPVAEFLQSIGYKLFRYQPYLKELIPIESAEALQGSLNIIALPADA